MKDIYLSGFGMRPVHAQHYLNHLNKWFDRCKKKKHYIAVMSGICSIIVYIATYDDYRGVKELRHESFVAKKARSAMRALIEEGVNGPCSDWHYEQGSKRANGRANLGSYGTECAIISAVICIRDRQMLQYSSRHTGLAKKSIN